MSIDRIRNFCIIAHIDHGKSTLADRFLELTGTVEKRKMREQFLDQMELEREKGITIKMQPVRMLYTRTDADKERTGTEIVDGGGLLYEDITYKIRGVVFNVRKQIGLGHKESVYQNALALEFAKRGIKFEKEKRLDVLYDGKKVGIYQPDFLVEDKVIVEIKALSFVGKIEEKQVWHYLKGTPFKLALLVNFSPRGADIERIINLPLQSVSVQSVPGPSKSVYTLNLIDTPGHVDFTYEVSRALAAVEGAILLVDGTQGIQAQTVANLALAKKEGLVIIPAINKIDLPTCRVDETTDEMKTMLGCEPEDIFLVSGKTGEGVEELLKAVIEKIPPPKTSYQLPVTNNQLPVTSNQLLRALVFDSQFDIYKGVVAHIRIFGGEMQAGDKLRLIKTSAVFEALEVGEFRPALVKTEKLTHGMIGYVASGLKEAEQIRVGDTITTGIGSLYTGIRSLAGYAEPKPVVFASVYPEEADDYERFREALKKLKLNDAALFFEPESSEALGRGFRMGFLGMLHLEITGERLLREYALSLVFSTPSVSYRIKTRSGGEELVYSAARFPENQKVFEIQEPWAKVSIITSEKHLGAVMNLLKEARAKHVSTDYLGHGRVEIVEESPLKEIIVDFYDRLKGVTEGYGSMSYEIIGYRPADLVKVDIFIAGDLHSEFSQIVPKDRAYEEGRRLTVKLKELMPPALFPIAIQAGIGSDIIARETVPALKKDVTGYLYGGDRTRKMKLWKKQQRGKKRLKERGTGSVDIPADVFIKMLKK